MVVTEENLVKFVDQPPWSSARLFEKTQPGKPSMLESEQVQQYVTCHMVWNYEDRVYFSTRV